MIVKNAKSTFARSDFKMFSVGFAEELINAKRVYKALRVNRCRSIRGSVRISGAKNSALPLLAASLLTDWVELGNFPTLLDTLYALQILEKLGKRVELEGDTLRVEGEISSLRVPFEISSLFRGSILFLGGLLGAVGRAEVAHPGGCAIGARPIDQHLKFLENLGATFEVDGGYIKVELPKAIKNRTFTFDVVTVTGTENALLTLAGVEGEFELHNVAIEPEVEDLIGFLRKLGMEIELKRRTIKVFNPKGFKGRLTHGVIPDRIEAGTFLVIGALLGEPLEVKNLNVHHLGSVLAKLREAAVNFEIKDDRTIRVYRTERPKALRIETAPYPGFPTDMQAQFTSMLAVAEGTSVVVENIFENRFQHALELIRMGADIEIKGNAALVRGVEKLKGAPVNATDLRASASLVIAGLIAEGTTIVHKIHHLLRGYEDLDKKLQRLGCEVELF